MNRGINPRFFRTLSILGHVICSLVISGILLEKILPHFRDRIAAMNSPQEWVLLTIHGVPVVKDLGPRTFDKAISIYAEQPNDADVDTFLPLIAKELKAYPSNLITKSHVSKIKLCKNLMHNGEFYGALVNFADSSIYIDVTPSMGGGDRLPSTIHHEFFHVLDKELLLTKVGKVSWESLNMKDFAYGPEPSVMRKIPTTGVPDETQTGFLNKYSTSDAREDRAEIFAYMMVRPDYINVRTKSDAILWMKVKEIEHMLNTFCPDINLAFWETRGLQVARK